MNKWEIKQADFVVLRTPFLAEETISILSDKKLGDNVEDDIKKALQRLIILCHKKEIIQAIGFASPSLVSQIPELNDSNSIENLKLASSIYKYIARMSTRCTPFGAFSSVMTLPIDDKSKIDIDPNMRLYIRLDNSCILKMAKILEDQAIEEKNLNLLVKKNNTLYKVSDEYRFVVKKIKEMRNDFSLDSVKVSDAIEIVLNNTGDWTDVNSLVSNLLQTYPKANKKAIVEFVFNLITNQLIVSNLTVVVSSKNTLSELIERALLSKTDKPYISKMKFIFDLLASCTSLQDNKLNQSLSRVKEALSELIPNDDLKGWLHVDSFREAKNQSYSSKKIDPILDTINKLADYFWKPNQAITEFTKQFEEKYGDSEVPLLEALDVDNGIQFGPKRLGSSPLLNGVVPQARDSMTNTVSWSGFDRYLLSKIIESVGKNEPITKIKADNIAKFKPYLPQPNREYPGSISLHGAMVEENNKPLFQLQSINGPSALMLLGRFCCGDKNLQNECEKIAIKEQLDDSEVIYAEINHVPQSKIANISCRPSLREYEIVYGLGDSNLPDDKQIKCEDLTLKIVNGRIFLYSKRLKKEIKPRLASAHNTSGLNLPVYQFLNSLQSIDGMFTGFYQNAVFHALPYMPEIRIDNIIISKQRWYITGKEIQQLKKCSTLEEKIIFFNKIKIKKYITRYIALSEGDNNLEFDLESTFTKMTFINEIIKRGQTVSILKSIKGSSDSEINHKQQIYRHEVIIPCTITNNKINLSTQVNNVTFSNSVLKKHTSLSGEKWKYLKVYTGEASADRIISKFLAPILNDLIENKYIKNWHFIRYTDPDFHLRIRLKLNKKFKTDFINKTLLKVLKQLYKQGLINKTVEDSYMPEITRYGGLNILPTAEKLFHYNSVIVAEFINSTSSLPNRDELRWQMCLRLAWRLTFSVCDSLEEMEQFFKKQATSYDMEFNTNSVTKKKLSINYRQSLEKVSESLSPYQNHIESTFISDNVYPKYYKTINKFINQCDLHKKDKLNILHSMLHMDCNRIFVLNPRMNEWIIYHYLARYIRTVIARKFIPGKDVIAGFELKPIYTLDLKQSKNISA